MLFCFERIAKLARLISSPSLTPSPSSLTLTHNMQCTNHEKSGHVLGNMLVVDPPPQVRDNISLLHQACGWGLFC